MKCYAQRSDKQAHSKPFAYSKFTHKLETQVRMFYFHGLLLDNFDKCFVCIYKKKHLLKRSVLIRVTSLY